MRSVGKSLIDDMLTSVRRQSVDPTLSVAATYGVVITCSRASIAGYY